MFLLPRDYFEEVGGGFLREEGVAERGGEAAGSRGANR